LSIECAINNFSIATSYSTHIRSIYQITAPPFLAIANAMLIRLACKSDSDVIRNYQQTADILFKNAAPISRIFCFFGRKKIIAVRTHFIKQVLKAN
jgi:hypothetical protein